MRCSYCYAPPRDSLPMSEETGRKAMEFGSKNSSGSCGIVFFGGEPLLQKDLMKSLVACGREMERLQAGRFHFKTTTNGLLLDESFLEFSLRNDLLIAMSFDGVREAHDQHRRLCNDTPSYDILVEKLRMLIEARPYASVLLVINPDTVSSYRAIDDLTINNDDFFEKLAIFDKYLSNAQKENYAQNLQFEYYSSNTLNVNKEYIGDHSILIASDIIKTNPELKNEIIQLISDENNGVWYNTSKDNRVLNINTEYKNQINTLLQEVTNKQTTSQIDEEITIDTIVQKFTDFNIAVYDITDTQFLEKSVLNSDAKYIHIDSKNDDLALHSQSVNKTFSYKIAGNILLEAKDNNADFIVVKSQDAFKLFDNKQKEIEKVVGREIQLPIITIKQFNHIVNGEKNPVTLGLKNHKVSVPFL